MSKNNEEILEETGTSEEKKASGAKKPQAASSRKDKLVEKELEETKKRVVELEGELADEKDKYLRMLAEYDNFRKRVQKEKEAIYGDAVSDSVSVLLAVLDNLERAAAVDVSQADAQSVVDGVKKILEQAGEVFAKLGVEEIPALGEEFNPELHNAVMHGDSDEYGENVVSEVFLKGYRIGEKVIRHSMVKVEN